MAASAALAGRHTQDRPAVLTITNLSKTFPGTRALKDVSMTVTPGSVHALLGGNGSGKSTLIKILAGVTHGDPGGRISSGRHEVDADHTSPTFARSAGLHVVHQNPPIFADMTVAENLAIGRPDGFGGRALTPLRRRAVHRRTAEVLDRFGIHTGPDTVVQTLGPAQRAMLSVARALQDQHDNDHGVLVLDEPTASLPAQEADLLLDSLRRWAAAGQAIIYVSHRLDEVIRLADTITVLRDGERVTTQAACDLTEAALVELIVGRKLDPATVAGSVVTSTEPVLEVRELSCGPVRDVSFELRRAEVLGVAGLLGSGRSSLLRALFGVQPGTTGQVKLNGSVVRLSSPAAAMACGLALVPEDRASEAALPDMTARANLSAADVGRYWRAGRLRHRVESIDAGGSFADFHVRAWSDRQLMRELSGGNQQKLVLARWLRRRPTVLLLDEPTQGVDVGARAEIYGFVRRAVADGTSVIIVSSDPEELAQICDRVIVLASGRIAGEINAPDINAHTVGALSIPASSQTSTGSDLGGRK
jgi:ribose transport system ATP-binding protein